MRTHIIINLRLSVLFCSRHQHLQDFCKKCFTSSAIASVQKITLIKASLLLCCGVDSKSVHVCLQYSLYKRGDSLQHANTMLYITSSVYVSARLDKLDMVTNLAAHIAHCLQSVIIYHLKPGLTLAKGVKGPGTSYVMVNLTVHSLGPFL